MGIAGTGSYLGSTTINDGELRIRDAANRLPITTALISTAPGILNFNGVVTGVGQQIGSLSGNGTAGLGASMLLVGDDSSTVFSGGSGQSLADDAACHVGQSLIAAVVAEGQTLVVEAEQMQDRRVDVVDVRLGPGNVQAHGVGRDAGCRRLDRRTRSWSVCPAFQQGPRAVGKGMEPRDFLRRECAIEQRQFVEQADVAQAQHHSRFVHVPGKGLRARGNGAARLAVKVETGDAVRRAGVEVLEGERDVCPFALRKRRLLDGQEGLVGHRNVLPLAIRRVPDFEVRIRAETERDAGGPLLELDEECGVIPSARCDLDWIAEARLEFARRIGAQPKGNRAAPVRFAVCHVLRGLEEDDGARLVLEGKRVAETALALGRDDSVRRQAGQGVCALVHGRRVVKLRVAQRKLRLGAAIEGGVKRECGAETGLVGGLGCVGSESARRESENCLTIRLEFDHEHGGLTDVQWVMFKKVPGSRVSPASIGIDKSMEVEQHAAMFAPVGQGDFGVPIFDLED